jgi:hypothetical protein
MGLVESERSIAGEISAIHEALRFAELPSAATYWI